MLTRVLALLLLLQWSALFSQCRALAAAGAVPSCGTADLGDVPGMRALADIARHDSAPDPASKRH
ncbi:MAG: hypothetical protein JO209_01900, partial [Acidisphaera sp.]|nr:hypothetical protein [Acidisphaera sp.]